MNKEKLKELNSYWHITSIDHTDIVFGTKKTAEKLLYHGNIYGPFKTLKECKKDAIEYHKTTAIYTRMAIAAIREIKAKELMSNLEQEK
jgi:hypothetical protein